MSGSWGCPHETKGLCSKVDGLPCDPGMKGCTLAGRYVFFNEEKNQRLRQKQSRVPPESGADGGDSEGIL